MLGLQWPLALHTKFFLASWQGCFCNDTSFIYPSNSDHIVCIVNRLWAGWLRNHSSTPGKDRKFFSFPFSRPHMETMQTNVQVSEALFPGVKQFSCEGDHFQLIPRLRMCGAICPLSPFAFMLCKGTISLYFTSLHFILITLEALWNYSYLPITNNLQGWLLTHYYNPHE